MISRNKTFRLASLLAFTMANSIAAEIRPEIGVPLRDASVLRHQGTDGQPIWYLTGTSEIGGNFQHNRGIRVWSSRDLQKWDDLGFVWDLHEDADSKPPRHTIAAWQTELYPTLNSAPGDRSRGTTAPRLAHDGDQFWISFSMNGYGAGALAGGSDIGGPWTDLRQLAECGAAPTGYSDAAIFTADGNRYLLWNGGCMAMLKQPKALEGLGAADGGIEGPVHFLPALFEAYPHVEALGGRGSPFGFHILPHDGKLFMVFSAATARDGRVEHDTFFSTADALTGPWAAPQLVLKNGGRATLFHGPDNALWLASSDPDAKPVLQPLPQRQEPSAPVLPPPASGAPEIATRTPARPPADWPADVPQLIGRISPLLDHPLRDAAITQGPDGTWYLTGTEGASTGEYGIDWSRNRGVRLWSSPDKVTWTDLGYVWELPPNSPSRLDPTNGITPSIGRAVTAPELHHLGGKWWIVYSLNGTGIGILESTSGKPAGPYRNHGLLVAHGRDPSLTEIDGRPHLVWGAGFVAPLNASMTALDGPVRTLFTNIAWNFRYMRRPELMGQWGSQLHRVGDQWLWTFTTRTGRNGINTIDTMATWSTSLDGPWPEPILMLPNGGQSTLVQLPDGTWQATVSGEDELSQLPFQAAVTPIVSNGKAGQPLVLPEHDPNPAVPPFLAVNGFLDTTLDLWKGYPDFLGTNARDVFILRDGDDYYMTGTLWGSEKKYFRDVVLFQSRDLFHWKELPFVYHVADLLRDGIVPDPEAMKQALHLDQNPRKWQDEFKLGETKIHRFGDRFYIQVQTINGGVRGHWLLKSEGDNPAGPYKAIQEIAGVADLMQDADGAILMNSDDRFIRFPDVAAFEAHRNTGTYFANGIRRKNSTVPNLTFSEDCEAGIMKIGEKLVNWTTDWTGSYDAVYHWSDQWDGPWTGIPRIIPYGGNGKFFQKPDGTWFYAYFMNSNDYATRAQTWCRLNMFPLHVAWERNQLIIEPAAQRANRQRIARMGTLWQTSSKP